MSRNGRILGMHGDGTTVPASMEVQALRAECARYKAQLAQLMPAVTAGQIAIGTLILAARRGDVRVSSLVQDAPRSGIDGYHRYLDTAANEWVCAYQRYDEAGVLVAGYDPVRKRVLAEGEVGAAPAEVPA